MLGSGPLIDLQKISILAKIMRHFFENRGNVAEYVRKLRTDFGRREAPLAPYVSYLLKKVKKLASPHR